MQTKLTPNRLRRYIQFAFTLYCAFIGWRFYAFLQWTTDNGPLMARPASVEAFLPISALMAFKRLVMTGNWDPIHPAGLTIFISALLMAWLLRKGFCAYVCPVGFLSSLLESAGRRIGLSRTLPRWLSLPLSGIKYLGLGFFLYTTLVSMPLSAINQFLQSPYNLTADARMMEFFTSPSNTALLVISAIGVLSIVIRNFWCRYLCPYGALLGLASFFSPTVISRDKESCIQCGKCSRACPNSIDVKEKHSVGSPECMGCTACIEACPVENCLSVRSGGKRLPYWSIAIGTVAILLGAYFIATLTGHWESTLPEHMAKMLYGRMM